MPSQLTQTRRQAQAAFERRDYATALALYESILATKPGFADIRHSVGLCLAFLGRPEEAIAQLDEALASNPGYIEAHINRALVLQELGRYDEARIAFDRAADFENQADSRFPAAATARLAQAHAAVGDIYSEIGAHDEAATQYASALELRPRFHDIRNKFASALLNMGRAAEAAAELERLLEWHPRFLAARLNLGLALFKQGRRDDAAAEWELCRAQQAENSQVRAYLAMIERTDAEEIPD